MQNNYILIYKTGIAVADLGGSEGAETPPPMPPLEILGNTKTLKLCCNNIPVSVISHNL